MSWNWGKAAVQTLVEKATGLMMISLLNLNHLLLLLLCFLIWYRYENYLQVRADALCETRRSFSPDPEQHFPNLRDNWRGSFSGQPKKENVKPTITDQIQNLINSIEIGGALDVEAVIDRKDWLCHLPVTFLLPIHRNLQLGQHLNGHLVGGILVLEPTDLTSSTRLPHASDRSATDRSTRIRPIHRKSQLRLQVHRVIRASLRHHWTTCTAGLPTRVKPAEDIAFRDIEQYRKEQSLNLIWKPMFPPPELKLGSRHNTHFLLKLCDTRTKIENVDTSTISHKFCRP